MRNYHPAEKERLISRLLIEAQKTYVQMIKSAKPHSNTAAFQKRKVQILESIREDYYKQAEAERERANAAFAVVKIGPK